MIAKIGRFLGYLRNVVCGEKVPVWLTILLIILGAVGTYFIAPKLNEGFQLQIAKREFLVASMQDFAGTTKSFIDDVARLVNTDEPDAQQRVELVAKAAELNFFAVQLSYIIPDERERLLRFQENVERVQKSIAQSDGVDDNEAIIAELKEVGAQALHIYEALAKEAGFGE
ncbi:MAG: hypothetical protein RIA09_05940 [Hoeflea sp.]|uniref:hypothetical protein n=1 Tax=Hoeflea sp. TaxID=1940281 RepID=UPI0032EF9741